jgi:hypothetical protein
MASDLSDCRPSPMLGWLRVAIRSGLCYLIRTKATIEWPDERCNARPACDAEENAFDATMKP